MSLARVLIAPLVVLVFAGSAAAQPSTVILVRHAERDTAPARDPVLTAAGALRAQALAEALASAGVSSVIATQFQRTQLTARPLADARGVTPIIVTAGGPTAAHVEAVAATVRARSTGEVVLVVGHSNTIPAIVGALGGPKLPDLCDTQYSMLYILEYPASGAPRFIQANYGAADVADAAACRRTPMR